MQLLQITMGVHDQPPQHRKYQPRQYEGQCKGQQCPTPLCVHQGGVHILQEPQTSSCQILLQNIAITIFEDSSSSHFTHAAGSEITGSKNEKVKKNLFILCIRLNVGNSFWFVQEQLPLFCGL